MRLNRLVLALATAAASVVGQAQAEPPSWRIPGDFPTIQAAIDSSTVADGDTLLVLPGRHAGATVTKALAIRATGHALIVSGPVVNALGKAGFLFPGGGAGSGSRIDGFRFAGVAFPVFSRGADDVSVTRNTMHAPNQGVTSWANESWGKGWVIAHNSIVDLRTRCGGGIGILIGDFAGGVVAGNVIAHNDVQGIVNVPEGDCGGYTAPGIVLFADFRYPGDAGAAAIEHNRVLKNRVHLRSRQGALVSVAGVQLADTRDLAGTLVVVHNDIVYNDLRGMQVPVSLIPDELAAVNRIEKNRTGVRGGWPTRGAPPRDRELAAVAARALVLPAR
jgi:hypothetical protein